jgi:hypothetical protein
MLNHQQHPNSNTISKLAVIVLSIILLTGISFMSVFQARVYAQQQPQQSQQGHLSSNSNRIELVLAK